MEILSTLSSALQTLTDMLPRVYFCPKYQGGILFVRGKHVKVIKPGLVVYWPLTTDIQVCPVNRQVLAVPSQTCCTQDGKTIVLAGVLTYQVKDVEKFLVDNWEGDEAIAEIVASVLLEVVSEKDWESIQTNSRKVVDNALTRKAQGLLEPYGCEVEKLRLTSMAPTKVLQIFGHNPFAGYEEA